MIHTKLLEIKSDFEAINKGDILAVEWKLNSYKGNNKTRFAVYDVYENLTESHNLPEIVLQKKNNVYFNYDMFCNGESNAKSVMLIWQKEG